MNTRTDKPAHAPHNLFWVLLVLILALCVDYGIRLNFVWQQHGQLSRASANQTQSIANLGQVPEFESKIRTLSFNLVQSAKTNSAAKQIVQEFGIQWTPPATNSATTP